MMGYIPIYAPTVGGSRAILSQAAFNCSTVRLTVYIVAMASLLNGTNVVDETSRTRCFTSQRATSPS